MPTWLAITIPSVIAVAACLMWALDYSKKAHEIQKLRLELEKLRRESEKEQSRALGLYTPTSAEIERYGESAHFKAPGLEEFLGRLGIRSEEYRDDVYVVPKRIIWVGVIIASVFSVLRIIFSSRTDSR